MQKEMGVDTLIHSRSFHYGFLTQSHVRQWQPHLSERRVF